MAYIGKIPATGAFQKCDALSASATADYTLQVGSTNVVPESVNHMIVSLNGVIQQPGATGGFTVSGSTLSFTSALTSADTIDFVMLLGNVLDIGTPSDDTVTLAKMASGTDGNIISYDASGNPVAIATGTAGHFLKSAGAGSQPVFASAKIPDAGQIFLTSDYLIDGTAAANLTANLTAYNNDGYGSALLSVSSGTITFARTGWYHLIYQVTAAAYSGAGRLMSAIIGKSTDSGSNWSSVAYSDGEGTDASDRFNICVHLITDITNVSTEKFAMRYVTGVADKIVLYGTSQSVTSFTAIRLGDT